MLVLSVSASAQTDLCVEITTASSSNVISVVPDGHNSLKPIADALSRVNGSKYANVVIKVEKGDYIGKEGVLISYQNIQGKSVCLKGLNYPTLRRTDFSGDTPAVVKVDGLSNVKVTGFNIEGVLTDDKNKSPYGVAVRNFSGKMISNITIEDNSIHSIGHTYKNCKLTDEHGNKISCGLAQGIDVNSVKGGNKITNVFIVNNKLFHLRLGKSEALTINNNVSDFTVKDNSLEDIDNIGIDIGGRQEDTETSDFQAEKGSIENNHIKGVVSEPYRNSSYPFVAGIYIDGGKGLDWDHAIVIRNNEVTGFGIGIEVGSENKYCNKFPVKCTVEYCKDNPTECAAKNCSATNPTCNYVRTQFVLVEKNSVSNNQLYGIGIGKDGKDQNSQTSNCRIRGNSIRGNNQAGKKYSELYFGSLEKDSLRGIEVEGNTITATVNEAFLVKAGGDEDHNIAYLTPDVIFNDNSFYKENFSVNLWSWNNTVCKKEELFDAATNLSTFEKCYMKGKNNRWEKK
jgi:hypothetical protein